MIKITSSEILCLNKNTIYQNLWDTKLLEKNLQHKMLILEKKSQIENLNSTLIKQKESNKLNAKHKGGNNKHKSKN